VSFAEKRSPMTFAYSLAATAKCIIILCTFFPVIIPLFLLLISPSAFVLSVLYFRKRHLSVVTGVLQSPVQKQYSNTPPR